MKKTLLLLLVIVPTICLSQKVKKAKEYTEEDVKSAYAALPKIDGQYEFTEIVLLDSTYKKDDLYKNAKIFFTNEFKSAKDVLQYDDRGEGKIIGKGNFHLEEWQSSFLVFFSEKRYVNFTLELFSKDGKYKYRIYGINADYTFTASGGDSPDHVTNGSLSLDESYQQSLKGSTKKMNKKLFMETINEIKVTISDIKAAMNKKPKDDF